jgi:prepilin peptidase CpaA
MLEFHALFELLGMLVTDPRTGVLLVLLIVAAASDWRSFRIPNWLTFGGAAFAVLYHSVAGRTPLAGLSLALGGLVFGLAIMLPMYVVRVMGAGDVKLMAMVGAFLGFTATLHAVLCIFIVGGFAAIGFALVRKNLGQMLINAKDATQTVMVATMVGARPDAPLAAGKSVGKLPYGVCICIGTIVSVVARQLGLA